MQSSDHMLSNVDERWIILAVLFLARTAMGFQFQSVAALSSSVVTDFRIDYAQLGLLIGLYLFPGIVIAYPGGLLGQYFGDKRIAVFGMALMIAGGLLTATSEYTVVLAGRLISGVGAVLLNVLLTKMTIDWFVGREIGTALAVLVSSWPIGIGVALVTLAVAFRLRFDYSRICQHGSSGRRGFGTDRCRLPRAAGRGPPQPSNRQRASALVAAGVRVGFVGWRCLDAVQCRLHPDRQLWSSVSGVDRIVAARTRDS